MTREEILAEFRVVIQGPGNRYLEEWKNTGGRMMGYFCTYVPRELFSAAGFVPVRLRGAGSTDSSAADTYLSNRVCTFVRHATSLALAAKYDFLDGAVFLNTCDHVRRANDVWRAKTAIGFFGFLSVPRTPREALVPWYVEEVRRLKSQMEAHFGIQIRDDTLREAIQLHNQIRQCLLELNEFRGAPSPKLSGEEMLSIALAAQLMPPSRFLELAAALLAELKNAPPLARPVRARVVVIGGELDEPEFLRLIESQGAAVVADNICFSSRAFSQKIPLAGDPLEAICRGYLFNIPCARMIGAFPTRYQQLETLMAQSHARGVIFQRMKFCDPWGGDAHKMLHRKKTTGLPLLVLDREYGVISTGQLKTRVQAFLEAMGV